MIVWLEKYYMYGVRTKQKVIPSIMFSQSYDLRCLFIKYLWATDGTIFISDENNITISYSSSSRALIDQLQYLLQSVGILSNIKENKRGAFTWYNLSVYSKYFQSIFLEEIGVAGSRKGKQVEQAIEVVKSKETRWTKYKLDTNGHIVYVPIKSLVNIGVNPVYDIEVERDHNFFANGLIVHNCIEQDADIIYFLHRPKPPELNAESVEMELICAKQRNGPVGLTKINYLTTITKFVDIAEEGYDRKS